MAQLEMLLKIKPKIAKVKIAGMLEISRSTLYEKLKRGKVEQSDTTNIKCISLTPDKEYIRFLQLLCRVLRAG